MVTTTITLTEHEHNMLKSLVQKAVITHEGNVLHHQIHKTLNHKRKEHIETQYVNVFKKVLTQL
jgi:ABC-type methionine transport system ATPase subunit